MTEVVRVGTVAVMALWALMTVGTGLTVYAMTRRPHARR